MSARATAGDRGGASKRDVPVGERRGCASGALATVIGTTLGTMGSAATADLRTVGVARNLRGMTSTISRRRGRSWKGAMRRRMCPSAPAAAGRRRTGRRIPWR